MRIKLLVCLMCFFLFYPKSVYATTYFDFKLDRNIVSVKSIITALFLYDFQGLVGSDFLVKPVFSEGLVYVFDETASDWILSENIWTKMPTLNKKMKLKVAGFVADQGNLSFKLLCKKTGIIYETPQKKLWNEDIYTGYTLKINENVSDFNRAIKQSSESNTKMTILNSIKNRMDNFVAMIRKMLKWE